jgi:uncharacterized repeat protein (TIGR01451 family)
MTCSKRISRSGKSLLIALALALSFGTVNPARGQSNGPIGPQFFGISVNNPPASPWPSTLGIPFTSWRTLGVEIKWSDIEQCDGGSDPTNACYVWGAFDSAISEAQTSGQDILYTIYATPSWASSNPTDTTCSRGPAFPPGSCDPPNDIDAVLGSGLGDGTNQHFDNFLTALMTHVGPGKILYWEVWDEPNVAHEWKGTNNQLLRLAKDTFSIIKGRDPNALITTPSYVGQGITMQFPTYLNAGGGLYADVISYHGYVQTGTCPNDCPIPENEGPLVANLRAVLLANGQQNKPVFDTEASWGNYLGSDTITDPDQQVAFTGRYYLTHLSSNVNKLYWYSWNNQANGHFYDTTLGTIIPAGVAYSQLYNWVVGATLTAPCSDFNTQWICTFTRTGSYVAEAIWDTRSSLICASGVCPTVNVPVPTNYSQYADLSGNTIAITNATVPVGSKPILVEGITPDITMSETVSPAVASTGGTATFSTVITNNTGGAISNVTVLDNLDPSLTFTNCSSTPNGVCSSTNNSGTVTFASMASGETDTITIVVQVSSQAVGTVLNTATAKWINASNNASDNWATTGVAIGTPAVSLKPSGMSFGNQAINTASATKNLVITNTGTGNLIINNVGTSGTNSAEFTFTTAGLPITVAPKGQTTIGVVFTPTSLGPRSASLYIYNNSSTSTLNVPLSGNGVSASTTTLASSLNPALLGQSVTFTAQVSCSSTVANPTGTVTFKRLNTTLAAVTLGSAGAATYTTSTLPSGWQSITGVYSGDVNCGTSKGSISQGIKLPSTVALNSSLNPSTQGQAVTFTAVVSSVDGGTPAGTVTFKNGGTKLGSVTLNSSAQARFTTSTLSKGTHSITAVYGGSALYVSSTSSTLSQAVQ